MNFRLKLIGSLLAMTAVSAVELSAQLDITPEMARRAREMGASQAQIDAAMNPGTATSAPVTMAVPAQDTVSEVVRREPEVVPVVPVQAREKADSTIFGMEIFANKNLTFAPNYNMATPPTYVLGPGDEVIIEVWGAAESRMKHRISPEGSINIQGIGPVDLNGLTIAEAQKRIQDKIGQIMNGQVKVTLGQIRSIKVNLSGEVAVPGTYTLPSLATVFNAIYSAGGVSPIGSLRDIRVYRNSKPVADLDVYDYLVNGKYETNIRLEDNDMIIVPPYDSHVRIEGHVKRPLTYELRKGETLGKLVEYAGGFSGDAYTDNVTVRRKSGSRQSIQTVESGQKDSFEMSDGDRVEVGAILPIYSNIVTIDGAVWRPGDYELSDKTATLSQLIARAEGLKGSEFASRGQLSRLDTTTNIYTVIPFNVREVAEGKADMALMNRDRVSIPNIYDLREEYTISISGEVNNPRTFEYRDGMTIEDVILQSGGLRESASRAKIEVARRIKNPDATDYTPSTAETFTFNISPDLSIAPQDKRFVLEPFDEIIVRRSPGYSAQQRVSVNGEVLFGGEFVLATAGERLSDIIRKAGGFTPEAYVHGASVQRKYTPDERAKAAALIEIARENKGKDSLSVESVETPEYYPVGVDVAEAIDHPGSSDDIVLQEGDRILVPKFTNTVRISGAVLYQNSVVYEGKRMKDYIYQAGGYKQNARKRPFVVYMNGKVAATRRGFFCRRYPKVEPGSQIVVPMKQERKGNGLANAMGMMTSTASLAAMVASIINLSK